MNRMNASPDTVHRSLSTRWLRAAAVVAAVVLHAAAVGAPTPATAVVTTPQVRAELVAHAPQGVKAGSPLMLGLLLQHQPGWHTYWLNAGDSGLATQLNWTLPQGMQAGNTLWPIPQMIRVGDMVNHGFEGQVLLGVPITLDSAFSPTQPTLRVQLQASWLVCKQECIPQEGRFEIQLPVAGSTANHAAAFDTLSAAQPHSLKPSTQTADVSSQGVALRIQGLPANVQGKPLQLFAEATEVLASGLGLPPLAGQWQGADYVLQAPLHAMRSSEPSQLGLLVVDGDANPAQAWRLNLKLQGSWPRVFPAVRRWVCCSF